ncbi:MAG: phosphocholine cytidylyltransferase family protein [Prevotella sp.]
MIDTAVIMAAGLGSRFGHMTETMPKGFIPVGGKAMVLRSIETLIQCGIKRIIIGTGYKHEAYDCLVEKYPQIECVYSERYAETNSMYTLYNCREDIGDSDFLLLESDIIFGSNAITDIISNQHPDIMLITPTTKFQDQYYVEYDDNGRLTRCSTDKSSIEVKGELVGIHKLSSAFYKKMCEEYGCIADKSPKLGYEYQLLDMSQRLMPLFVLNAHDVKWYEIDDELDLKYAEENVIPYI